MQQIADWLEKLGMSEYAQRFAENKIDVSVLRHLTDQDLKDIGVPLGHRRKMLAAIGELGDATPASTEVVAGAQPKTQDTAERRQVTVMFSDLVGSTALSARMDPEDLREVISAYQKCVAETVQRFGGFVAKYMGDGVLIYFGYPQAHEDDADRAVRAGLEVIAAVSALKSPVPLQTRVGIATGMVVVGDLIGSGEAQERGIVGETPNLAARLQGIAEPNMVVIADGTRQLIGDLFELQYLGSKDLKGIAGPVRGWVALRASLVESRFEAMHGSGLTALVGREEELELLLRRWSKAKSGEGQVVLLSGEAGIGKSRLTAALLERLSGEPHTRLRYFCSPQHTDSAFHPTISQMERAAGFSNDDAPKAKLDKLDAVLAQSSASPQDKALIAEMLLLPNDGRYPVVGLPPPQRRQKTMEALLSQVQALAQQTPVLMLFEDAHWSDPTSLELFGRAVERMSSLRVLLMVTFRPEFASPWIGRSHVTSLTINRLTRREVETLIDRIVGNKSLPANISQDVIERTDGIPLFVEEMTKTVLETEGEEAAERTVASVPSPARAVPASLHASLLARLDRLGPAKGVAQIGAAIGREFSHALLAAVARKPEGELDAALERLIEAGLLFRQGLSPDASYLFKHALVQDAAYGTLLREPRRALHARIAETIETQFPEIAEGQPQLVARHCSEGHLIEKSVGLWGKAGQRSLGRTALIEAVEQLSRALTEIAKLPGTATLRREQIRFQIALANALMLLKGFAAPEAKAAFEQANSFVEQAEAYGEHLDDPLSMFSVLYGFWVANQVAFNGDAVRELARQFLALADKQAATIPRMIGHRLVGMSLLNTGDVLECRPHFDRALTLYQPAEHEPLAARFGQDIGVTILSWRAFALWLLGFPDAALADVDSCLKHARAVGHAASLMYALTSLLFTTISCGRYTAASAETDELVSLGEETGALFWKAAGMGFRGSLSALAGRTSEAVPVVTAALTAYRSTGATYCLSWHISNLARAHGDLGQFDDAERWIVEALAMIRMTKETMLEPEVNRIAGELRLKLYRRDEEKAQTYFERALAVARKQQAKSWELRAAMSMARLWREQGKAQQARELLAPVYGWFTEGFDTLDLKEAKALLDALTP